MVLTIGSNRKHHKDQDEIDCIERMCRMIRKQELVLNRYVKIHKSCTDIRKFLSKSNSSDVFTAGYRSSERYDVKSTSPWLGFIPNYCDLWYRDLRVIVCNALSACLYTHKPAEAYEIPEMIITNKCWMSIWIIAIQISGAPLVKLNIGRNRQSMIKNAEGNNGRRTN